MWMYDLRCTHAQYLVFFVFQHLTLPKSSNSITSANGISLVPFLLAARNFRATSPRLMSPESLVNVMVMLEPVNTCTTVLIP